MKNILITGGCGYIGSTLVDVLLKYKKYNVYCIDNFENSTSEVYKSLKKKGCKIYKLDFRNFIKVKKIILKFKIDCCIHLAAIVGDPACKLEPKKSLEVNLHASKNLFEVCRNLKVKKFIFSSTCSNYGITKNKELAKETTTLNPLSLYAKTKVNFEKYLYSNRNADIKVVILRFATVFGLSKRMRFDLTVNQFVRDIFYKKKLYIFSENSSRPYCHVRDISNCIILAMKLKKNFEIFNVGESRNNFSKKQIIEKISKYLPIKNVFFKNIKDFDRRDYKVSFDKAKKKILFKVRFSIDYGIKEIINFLKKNKKRNFYSPNFINS